jgi:hypothetical protein
VLAAAVSGCGLGAGRTPAGVALEVTQDFGARQVAAFATPRISGQDTVMRLLERNTRVATRYGGGFVQSIDGLAGGSEGGHRVDWFYYVNGVEAPKGAAATVLHGGDHVWWDRHDWTVTDDVPAVVGSFPEPFLDGESGQRLPTRIECSDPSARACAAVSRVLNGFGVPAARGGLGLSEYNESLRVLVGPWSVLRADPAAAQLGGAPAVSGVYGRFEAGGAKLALLDADGRVVRVAGAGAGLIAATRYQDGPPVWLLTGTDNAGVAAAAQAFDSGTLHDHFAVAVVADAGVPLPANA